MTKPKPKTQKGSTVDTNEKPDVPVTEAPETTQDEKAEALAENLEKKNTATKGKAANTKVSGQVFVFSNLPTDQSFSLDNGQKKIVILGCPVSQLKKPGGGFFAGGKYGVTQVPEADWKEVMRVYGSMRFFKSGLVFSADSLENGTAMAKERGDLRHGYEPLDPNSREVKTKPKTED